MHHAREQRQRDRLEGEDKEHQHEGVGRHGEELHVGQHPHQRRAAGGARCEVGGARREGKAGQQWRSDGVAGGRLRMRESSFSCEKELPYE